MKMKNIVWVLAVLLVISTAINVWLGTRSTHVDMVSSQLGVDDSEQLYTCGMHPNVVQEGPGNCPICGMNLTPMRGSSSTPSGERKIRHWRAPMDPNYISDQPGKSPMGMDLVPVYEDEVQGTVISIDPSVVQNIGVRTATVQRKNLSRSIITNGIVTVDESRTFRVNPKISGWIEKLHVNETGQLVSKDQPLLDIYSPELVTAQEEYLLALKGYTALTVDGNNFVSNGAEGLLRAARERLTYWDITDSQIAELEATRQVSRVMTFYSPTSGVVIHKNAVEGGYAKAGMDLFQIADLSEIWIEAEIYEYELPWVRVGQNARITVSYDPAMVYNATISYIYPYLNPKTRTAKVRISLSNPRLELKLDMYVEVQIDTRVRNNVVSIPREAVVRSGKRDVVFLVLGEGRFLPREITLGLEADDFQYEVLSGLTLGDRIVTSAQFLLDSEAQLQEALQKLISSRGSKKDTPVAEVHSDSGESVLTNSSAEHEGHVASGATMSEVFEADKLYHCPMHPEIVTSDSDARCPHCNMFLEEMSSEKVMELRDSHPHGCTMCPVIRPEAEKDKKCSICGMFLQPIEPKKQVHS